MVVPGLHRLIGWKESSRGASDTAIIPSTTNSPVISTSRTISGLAINAGAVVTVDNSGALTLQGNVSGDGNLDVSGTLTWNAGTTMSGTGTTNINTGGTCNISMNGGGVTLDARTFNNAGTVVWTSNSGWTTYVQNGATFNNQAGGIFDARADTTIGYSGTAGTFANAGTFKKTSSTGTTTMNIPFTNTGTVDVQSGTFAFNGSSFNNSGASIIKGNGVITVGGATSFVNAGNVSPGASPGILTLSKFPQTATSNLNLEIGGLTVGTDYDQLAVSGIATLNGALNVSLVNDYIPVEGDTFTIMTYASETGQFATTNLPALGGDLDWDLAYNATSVILTVTPDTTPPTVSSTDPVSNATEVSVGSVITATFSEDMDAGMIITATFTVTDGTSNIAGTVSYRNKTATFNPEADLAFSTTYTAIITTGVKDLTVNAIAANYTWGFTTETAPDTTPDAFTFTDQTDVALSTPITSNTITVAGINSAASLSITGGEYSINGGAYTSTADRVVNGDMVTLRQTSSADYSMTTDAMLTIGGVSDTFSVTTITDTITVTFDGYQYVNKWGMDGTGDGQFIHPKGVSVDASGNVYVSDYHNHRIQVFSPVEAIGSAPTATTSYATDVTSSSATLNGTVIANGLDTTAWFEYGTAIGVYTNSTTAQSASGTSTAWIIDRSSQQVWHQEAQDIARNLEMTR